MDNLLRVEAVAMIVMAAKRPAAGLQHPTVIPETLTSDDADDGTANCPACGQPLGEH
jgi:hypothetical protein